MHSAMHLINKITDLYYCQLYTEGLLINLTGFLNKGGLWKKNNQFKCEHLLELGKQITMKNSYN